MKGRTLFAGCLLLLIAATTGAQTKIGYLLEAGVGPFSGGHEQLLNPSSGHVDSSNLLFVGAGDQLGAFEGASGDNSSL